MLSRMAKYRFRNKSRDQVREGFRKFMERHGQKPQTPGQWKEKGFLKRPQRDAYADRAGIQGEDTD